ncbi:MAG: MoaD/ThiS family protein [Deltaproteobacteria bacterium]|nr:MoaD/ThiS family protein [Deltaproteobacteria bacterium]
MRILIELWMWLGEELGQDFQSPTSMRSAREMDVEEGTTVIQLFDRLAARYPPIGEKIFNRGKKSFYPNLSVIGTRNGQVISPFNIENTILKDGDKITVLPLYAGG